MDDNVVGMQMTLFAWADAVERAAPSRTADVLDCVAMFHYRRGAVRAQRRLRMRSGEVLQYDTVPVDISGWRR